MSRDDVRLIIGLRSGKLRLNEYLCNRLKKVMSPKCKYCKNENENTEHLIGNNTKKCNNHIITNIRRQLQSDGQQIFDDEIYERQQIWTEEKSNQELIHTT